MIDLTDFHIIRLALNAEILVLKKQLKEHDQPGLSEYLSQAKMFLDAFEQRAVMIKNLIK